MKSSPFQLAAFGGAPAFSKPLHVGQPVLINQEAMLADIESVMRSGQLTNNGPRLQEFESAIAKVCRTKHAIATCNATIALQIAARALQLSGEVIVPAFTFIATAHALEWIGIDPVFADVDPETHTLDLKSTEACITSRTSGIIPVHLWGHVSRTRELQEFCRERKLRLLYDSSHAFGCQQHGTPVGNFGDAEVFSFHATKFVHAFEGGAIVTNDDSVADRCRRLRAFGISGLTEISDVGTNGKMHELSAVAGLHSIATMSGRIAANRANRMVYACHCQSLSGLSLLSIPEGNESNGQYLVLTVDEQQFGLNRDQIVSLLRAEGVFARSYFSPGCHQAEPYRSAAPGRHVRVPLDVTETLARTVLQLPTGPAVAPADAHKVGLLLRLLHQHAAEIRRLWSSSEDRLHFHPGDPARPAAPAFATNSIREMVQRDPKFREAG